MNFSFEFSHVSMVSVTFSVFFASFYGSVVFVTLVSLAFHLAVRPPPTNPGAPAGCCRGPVVCPGGAVGTDGKDGKFHKKLSVSCDIVKFNG